MKLLNITESLDIDEIKQQPYFDQFKRLKLFHSTGESYDEIRKLTFRFRTKPSNTDIRFHNIVNNFSEKRFGLPIRNLLFAYPSPTGQYGHPYMVVPIGANYQLYYNMSINDMTMQLDVDDLSQLEFDVDVAKSSIGGILSSKYSLEFINELVDDSFITLHDYQIQEALDSVKYNIEDENDYQSDEYSKLVEEVIDQSEKILKISNEMLNDLLRDKAIEYLDDVEILSDDRNINEIKSSDPEIMVYAPDGFYLIPHDIIGTIVT